MGEKIASHISDNGLIPKIFTELLQVKRSETKEQSEIRVFCFDKHFYVME